MSATLGGLLDAAAAGIGTALNAGPGPAGAQGEAAWQLGRLATVMARCLDQVTSRDQVEAAWRLGLTGRDRAVIDAAAALRLTASRLGKVTGGDDVRTTPVPGSCGEGLARAAGALAAAADLMATHTGTGPDGVRFDRSPWAAVYQLAPRSAVPLLDQILIAYEGDRQ